MIDRGKQNLLGVRIDAVDYEAAIERIISCAERQLPLSVSALAVHGVMTGVLDATHRHRLNALDLVVPDGQPVRWGLNALHRTRLPDRVYGPELMLQVCNAAQTAGLPIYLFGGTAALLKQLSDRLTQRFPDLVIAGQTPSRFRTLTADERRDLIATIVASGARITFVGLGCPRQEVWVYEFRDELRMPLLAVGAAFAFHAGVTRQAPRLAQRTGLEWLYRLACEPRRLWRRYVLLNPLYLGLLALQWSGLRGFDPARTVVPNEEILYG